MSIPRRIIQTAKTRNLEGLGRAAATNLKLLLPDWEYLFFDDRDVALFIANEFPEYEACFHAFPQAIQRWDFFRYLAIFRLGGFYFDLDVFLSESIDSLLDEACVFPFEELTLNRFLNAEYGMDWEIGNYAFGATQENPFLRAVIANCIRAQRDPVWVQEMMSGVPRLLRADFYVLNTTGPGLLSRTLAENPELARQMKILFPENVCASDTWHQFGTYGIHVMDGSWRSDKGFIRQRLTRRCELWWRARLLRQSIKLGPTRSVRPARGRSALATN